MLKINPPKYKYCPFCGKVLKTIIEEEKSRKFCTDCNWTYYPHVAAAVSVIIKKKSKILLVKRNREPYKNTWMLPAGFMNYGEHPEDTARRETLEEVGMKVSSLKLINIMQSEDDPRSPGHLMFMYIARASGKLKNGDLDENSEIAWFGLSKLPKIGWKNHLEILKNISNE